MTPDQVAERLGVTLHTVRYLATTGKLAFVQLSPQTRRFLPSDVETYIESCRRDSSTRS